MTSRASYPVVPSSGRIDSNGRSRLRIRKYDVIGLPAIE
jgi:hypothetical protein